MCTQTSQLLDHYCYAIDSFSSPKNAFEKILCANNKRLLSLKLQKICETTANILFKIYYCLHLTQKW